MNSRPVYARNTDGLDPRIGVLMREGRRVYYVLLSGRCVERRSLRGMRSFLERHDQKCLTRANGWGFAGSCPACHVAKTPAARERMSHVVAAGNSARDTPIGETWQGIGEGVAHG